MKRRLFIYLFLAAVTLSSVAAADDVKLEIATIEGAKIDAKGYSRNAVTDYGMVSSKTKNQSRELQAAIDDMSIRGGGNLLLPKGEYCFADVYMRSNVQLRINAKATLYPYYTPKTQNVIMLNFTPSKRDLEEKYIENCSVSCYGGDRYTVDYSHFVPDGHEGLNKVRFALARLVRNFTIADANIMDHYTKFCGVIFVGAEPKEASEEWEVSRPTNGLIRNCRINNASHGYGMCQLHAARNLLFEDMEALGGVTLRLEAHAGGSVGVFDIYARNIKNEYGKAAVMMNPHVVDQGMVTIDGVESRSSAFAVLIRPGFINKEARKDPNAKIGSYANGSRINNIHSIFGTKAQTEKKDVWIYEPDMLKYIKRAKKDDVYSQIEGASYTTVFDNTAGSYSVICTNVTYEGYPNHVDGVLRSDEMTRTPKDTRSISEQIEALK